MNDIRKYIETGISIDGDPEKGYCVFTIPTQHFHIDNLDELTPERFELEIENQRILDDLTTQMFNCYYDDNR